MMGPYCQFCALRCFVTRSLPDRSWSGLMATCAAGMVHDRKALGYDHTTAINPVTVTKLINALHDITRSAEDARRGVHAVLLILAGLPIPPGQLPAYTLYLEEMTADDRRAAAI